MSEQYIYILSLSNQIDLIKVGQTSKNPFIRANELSKQTAATNEYTVE
jgi:hypothetical protein